MITFLTGTPGTGKTLNAVKRYIISALRARRTIYTNIPLSVLHLAIFLRDLSEIEIEELIKPYTKYTYKEAKANSLIIIDEAQNFYNNRDFKDEDNKDFIAFLTRHRHYGIDVVILTQHFEQVDIGIRRNAETCIVLKSLRNLGFAKQIKAEFYGNALDLKRNPIASQKWTIDPDYYSLYKSYESEMVSETKKHSFNVILRSPFVWVIFAVVGWNVYNVFSGKFVSIKDKLDSRQSAGSLAAPMAAAEPAFNLGEYDEYYCGDKFYVLRPGGKIDTIQPKVVPPSYCPHVNFNFKRVNK